MWQVDLMRVDLVAIDLVKVDLVTLKSIWSTILVTMSL